MCHETSKHTIVSEPRDQHYWSSVGSSFFKNNVIQESSRTVPENFFKKLQESLTTGVQAVLEKHMILKVILTFSVIKIVHTLFLPYRLYL